MSYQQRHAEIMRKVKSSPLANPLETALHELLALHESEVRSARSSDAGRGENANRVERIFLTSDGERLIERAFRTDPKQTERELNYLGAHEVAGQLKVKLGLEQQAAEKALRAPVVPASA